MPAVSHQPAGAVARVWRWLLRKKCMPVKQMLAALDTTAGRPACACYTMLSRALQVTTLAQWLTKAVLLHLAILTR